MPVATGARARFPSRGEAFVDHPRADGTDALAAVPAFLIRQRRIPLGDECSLHGAAWRGVLC